jgi:3-hydroxyisobutyrate dehydrogenase
MASSLVRDGLEVRAWNRTRGKLDELAGEASVAVFDDPAEAAAGAEVILTMLSDGNATLEVIEAAAAGAEGDVVWAQMGTIGIDAAELCIDAAERLGLTLVDAPVLGTKQPAEAGELVILGSGPQEAREHGEEDLAATYLTTAASVARAGGGGCRRRPSASRSTKSAPPTTPTRISR